ncbi:hypothetical protein D9M71_497960 [compost metagenome]
MPDQEREHGRQHATEVVAKAHPGAAHVSRVQLIEERTQAGRDAGGEKAQREAEEQHLGIGQREKHVGLHGQYTAQGEQQDVLAPANTVDQQAADHAAAPEGQDDHRQVTARVQHRKVALCLEESRQPGHHRVVATVGTQAEQAAQQGHTQQFRAEDASHRLQEAGRDGLFLLQALEAVRLRHVAAYPNDQQRWQQTDEEHHPPGKLLRHQ